MTNQPEQAARGPGRLNAAEAALLEDRLLDAAEAVFVEQGYARATMDQIAKRGGVGRKTVYARYSNKTDVLAAVVDRLLDSAMAEEPKRAAGGRGDARSQLTRMARKLASLSESPHVAGINRLIFAEAVQTQSLAGLYFHLHARAAGEVQAKQEELQSEGELPALANSRLAAAIFIEMAASLPRLHALLGAPLSRKETNDFTAAAVDIFLNGCAASGD
jgi:AcrR family transcriptional regulator